MSWFGHKIKSDRYSEDSDPPLHSMEQQPQHFLPGLQPLWPSVNTPAVVSSRLHHLISRPRKGEPKTNASPKPNHRRRIAAVELNHSQRGCILGELAISCVDIRSKYPNLRDWLVPFVLSPTPRIGQNPTIGAASQQRDPWQRPNSKQRRARERETINSPGYARHGMTVNCFCRFDLSTFTTLRLYEFTQPTTCISIIIPHSLTYTTQPAPIFPTPTHQNKTPTPATHPPTINPQTNLPSTHGPSTPTMPPNPGVTILILLSHASTGILAFPIVLHRRDDVLPPRDTALNVFAALFTILVLVIIAMWVIMRLINKALTTLSATVTGSGTSSSSTSGTGETSTTLS